MAYSGYCEELPVDDTPGAELGGAAMSPWREALDVRADLSAAERGAIARRIGAIVAQCQREAEGGMVAIGTVELRLAVLADDVRSGLHGAGGDGE